MIVKIFKLISQTVAVSYWIICGVNVADFNYHDILLLKYHGDGQNAIQMVQCFTVKIVW